MCQDLYQMTPDGEVQVKEDERTKCEVWTRCMGYHRPVECFNIGKKAEYASRKFFKMESADTVEINEAGLTHEQIFGKNEEN